MRTVTRLCLICCLLFITAHRVPAPIVEESSTPSSEHTPKPRPRRTVKPTATENSEPGTKRTMSSAKRQPTAQRNVIDGTWVGILNAIQFTALISGAGTVVRETSTDGTFTWNATYDGTTMRWTWHRPLISGDSTATVIDPNGRRAIVTSKSGGAPLLLGAGAHNSSAVFYKTSP
jgi:hypothetical protein